MALIATIFYLFYHQTMDVSIIIVSYNTSQLLKNCLNSVFEKTQGLNFEVIVVDNDSKDDSCSMLERDFSQVKLIRSKENLGFGRANNLGMEQAKGKYLFLLNPDCLLINNSVKILYDFMENNSDCGACGGNLYDENLEKHDSFGMQTLLKDKIITHTPLKFIFPGKYKKLRGYKKDFDRTKDGEVGFITGADLMLRKSVIDEVGNFDQRFFLFFEETELQNRILKAGYKIFFVAESQMYHFEAKSPNPRKKLFMQRSEYIYFRITQGVLAEITVRIISLPKHLKYLLRTVIFNKA